MSPWLRALCALAAFIHLACAVALAWEAGELQPQHAFAALMVGVTAVLAAATGVGYALVTHLHQRDIM